MMTRTFTGRKAARFALAWLVCRILRSGDPITTRRAGRRGQPGRLRMDRAAAADGASSGWARRTARDGTHRHLGVAVRRLARQVLSAGARAEVRARLCGRALRDNRAERQLLFAAAPVQLRA